MIPWIRQFHVDLDQAFGRHTRIATLATVHFSQGVSSPAARSVVLRGIGEGGELQFVSDARSEKNAELRANPHSTLVFWLQTLRRQYRFDGAVQILDASGAGALREQTWQALSDESRALFFWPPPCQPLDKSRDVPLLIEKDNPVPSNFEVLIFSPVKVDLLDLTSAPHGRTVWNRTTPNDWESQEVNP